MNYENQGHAVRIKDLLFSVLYQWKTILLWAVVLALLAGIYSAVTTHKTLSDAELLAEYAQQDAAALADYEAKEAALQLLVENAEKQLEDQVNYLENSLLMNMDYHSVAVANVSLFISTDYQILPGMEYQNPDTTNAVSAAYEGLLTSKEALSTIAADLNMEVKYLQELITVINNRDQMLNIFVYHENEESARKITRMLIQAVDSYHDKVAQSISANTVTVVLDTVGITVDTDLANKQQAEKDLLQKYRDNLQTQQDKLNQLPRPALHQIPQMRSSVKWLVIGGVVGAVLALICVCIRFLVSDKLYGAEGMQIRFDIRVLGGAAIETRKCSAVNRWLKKKEGRVFKNSDVNDQLLAANVRSFTPDMKTVLVAGSAQEEAVVDLLGRLQVRGIELRYCGSLLTSAEALNALPECDGVLLVETCGASTYWQIRKTLDYADNAGKPVVGAILFE